MNYFIYIYIISLLTGRYELNKLTSLPMCGFIAQLVEHRTGIAEVTGSNPVEALIFFFRLLLSSCLNWKIHCMRAKSHLITISKIKYIINNFFIGFSSHRYLCVCRVMEDDGKVEILDLHSAVIHECGEPPYETCSIMKRPRDVVRYF